MSYEGARLFPTDVYSFFQDKKGQVWITSNSRSPVGQRLEIGGPWQEAPHTIFLRLGSFLEKISLSGFPLKIINSGHSGLSFLHRHKAKTRMAAILFKWGVCSPVSQSPALSIVPQLSWFIIYVIFPISIWVVTSNPRFSMGKSFCGPKLINPPLI